MGSVDRTERVSNDHLLIPLLMHLLPSVSLSVCQSVCLSIHGPVYLSGDQCGCISQPASTEMLPMRRRFPPSPPLRLLLLLNVGRSCGGEDQDERMTTSLLIS